ncbi:MAG TPA: aldose epimerase family protein [Usitatibacter sp.]|nr:aldose epimerase family protein [Usitatibacter sp.]
MRVYILESERLRARVLDFGATLMSLEAPDRGGRFGDVVLGFDDPERYRGAHPYFGGIVGRYANRIALGRFELDGARYQLACNDGRHHLHGGQRGFDRVLWKGEQDAKRVELTYRARDGEEGYPGTLEVKVRYSVDAGSLRIDYYAVADRPTVLNLTNHAYFNLAGAGTIHAHRVRIPAKRYVAVDAELIPTGELAAVAGTDFDFNAAKALDDPRFDHTFVLDGEVEVSEPTSGRILRIATSQPGIQFYTGNLLDGSITGKAGARYVQHAGLCLEPQHFPDSPNRRAFPSTVLRPGSTYHHYSIYTL